LATSGDFLLATSGDFLMAMDTDFRETSVRSQVVADLRELE